MFLLSTFVGVVVFMLVYLDYCRRTKKKRRHLTAKYFDEDKLWTMESQKERIELNPKTPEHHACREYNNNNHHNNNNNNHHNNNNHTKHVHGDIEEECEEEEEKIDVYANTSVASPFLKRNYDLNPPINGRHLNMSSPMADVQDPQRQLRHDAIVPPPDEFTERHRCVTSSRPHTMTSYISDTSLGDPRHDVGTRRHCGDVGPAVGQSYDELNHFNERNGQRVLEYHLSETFATPAKYIGPPKRNSAKKELPSSRVKCSGECECKITSEGRSRSSSLHQFQRNNTNNNMKMMTNQKVNKRSWKMQKCDENALQTYNFTQHTICSDNEASRRKRRCVAEYKRGGGGSVRGGGKRRRNHGNSLSDIPCRCRKTSSASSNFNCCSSVTSNGQSSPDEEDDDEFGLGSRPPFSSQDQRSLKKDNEMRCLREESGYQTRDTGTDSLCSSSVSTDQEDNRMFLPLHTNLNYSSCKSKSCSMRNYGNRQLRGNGHGNGSLGNGGHGNGGIPGDASKVSRHFQKRGGDNGGGIHTTVDVPPPHKRNCTSTDVPTCYDSSLDDDYSTCTHVPGHRGMDGTVDNID